MAAVLALTVMSNQTKLLYVCDFQTIWTLNAYGHKSHKTKAAKGQGSGHIPRQESYIYLLYPPLNLNH